MPMEDDPNLMNDADRQIEANLYTEAQKYAETRIESRSLNEKRATSRKKVEQMGFRKDAYQVGIRIVKDLSTRERSDFMRDLQLITKVLGKRQADLFPEEALKAAKREDDRKRELAEAKAAEGRSPDHPRSDPKKGGAGKAKASAAGPAEPSGGKDPIAEAMAAKMANDRGASSTASGEAAKKAAETEQREGDDVLSAGLQETKQAQSKIASDRLAKAGLN